jgi:hypothetical protein
VHEVEVRAVGDAVEERVRPDGLDRVPADVRQRRRVFERDRSAGQQAQRFGAALVAGVEQELEAQADAEARPAGPDPVAQRLQQTTLSQVGHRRSGGADARHDDRVDAAISDGVGGHDDFGPDRGQGLVMLTMFAAP